jgi:hypothetical protein
MKKNSLDYILGRKDPKGENGILTKALELEP